ncbi:MAG: hypothetical protein ACRAVC_24410 [Trichormus sp.]
MSNCLELTATTNQQGSKNIYSQYYFSINYKNQHKAYSVTTPINKINSNSVNSSISDQIQSLTKEADLVYQGYTMQNQQCGKNINILWKLYRSILSKYRYTSLELTVRSVGFIADAVAKFSTDDPALVGSGDKNK